MDGRGAVARRAERKHDLSLRVAKDPRHGGKRAEETEQRIDGERGDADKRSGSDDFSADEGSKGREWPRTAFPRR